MLFVASTGLAGNLIVMFFLKHYAQHIINIQSAIFHVIYDTVSSVAVIITVVNELKRIQGVVDVPAYLDYFNWNGRDQWPHSCARPDVEPVKQDLE